jgi:hypothetical protein
VGGGIEVVLAHGVWRGEAQDAHKRAALFSHSPPRAHTPNKHSSTTGALSEGDVLKMLREARKAAISAAPEVSWQGALGGSEGQRRRRCVQRAFARRAHCMHMQLPSNANTHTHTQTHKIHPHSRSPTPPRWQTPARR